MDIGDAGRQNDGSVYTNSNPGLAIENNTLMLPCSEQLKNSREPFPYVFLADDTFALKPHILKPYPRQNLWEKERIFNYILSHGQRIIENTFGITA